jgi:glycosyltransferase 2 family protein
VARPVVRGPSGDDRERTQPRRAVQNPDLIDRIGLDTFAQSVPGVALFETALSGKLPAVKVAPAEEISREELSLGRRLLSWKTIVPMAIIIALLVLAIKNLVTGLNFSKVGTAIATANLALVFLGFIIYYASYIVRVARWRILLGNVGMGTQEMPLPRFAKLFEILFLSFFANTVVPAKLGDVYRAYLLKQETGSSGTRSFGTVLAERLLDFIVLLILFVGAALFNLHRITTDLNPSIRSTLEIGLIGLAVVIIGGVIGLMLLRIYREPIRTRVPERFKPRFDDFQEGTLGSFKHLPALTGLSAVVWLLESMRFLLVAWSIQLFTGDPLTSFFGAMFVALGESLLTVVPFTSGGIGIVEAGMLAMLMIFSSGSAIEFQNHAAAAIVLDRLISLVSLLVMGGILYLFVFVRSARKQIASTN